MMNVMDLLERYLQAVGQYLPDDSREDTLAELRANLLEQMEARVEEYERPMDAADVAAVLKAHGKPELVALRYLPQQSLIGPTIFPFYKFTLVRVMPLVIFASVIAGGVRLVSGRHGSLAHALVRLALGLIPSLLISAAIITLIFAAIEMARERGKLGREWHEWDPAKLPAVKASGGDVASPRSMAKRVVELVIHCLWFAYVLWVPWHPFWIMGPGVFYMDGLGVALGPVWHTFYVLLLTLLTVQLVMRLLAFVPSAQRWLQPMRFVSDLLGVVAMGLLAASSIYFVPVSVAADLHKIASVNHSIGLAFRIAFVVAVVGFVKDSWQDVKRAKLLRQMAF
jgi:hypothetical protein